MIGWGYACLDVSDVFLSTQSHNHQPSLWIYSILFTNMLAANVLYKKASKLVRSVHVIQLNASYFSLRLEAEEAGRMGVQIV